MCRKTKFQIQRATNTTTVSTITSTSYHHYYYYYNYYYYGWNLEPRLGHQLMQVQVARVVVLLIVVVPGGTQVQKGPHLRYVFRGRRGLF